MPYNFAAGSFHTKKLCSRLSSSEVRFYTKNGRFAFSSLLWGLRGNECHYPSVRGSISSSFACLNRIYDEWITVAASVVKVTIDNAAE